MPGGGGDLERRMNSVEAELGAKVDEYLGLIRVSIKEREESGIEARLSFLENLSREIKHVVNGDGKKLSELRIAASEAEEEEEEKEVELMREEVDMLRQILKLKREENLKEKETQNAELDKLRQNLKNQNAEVEKLRQNLKEKEKENAELEKELKEIKRERKKKKVDNQNTSSSGRGSGGRVPRFDNGGVAIPAGYNYHFHFPRFHPSIRGGPFS
ncbi:hypothetical protein CCACVL1_17647 [Corchorus capsularis]|uniref:Uncharacterized protein n=1 Tax=Corchorus capsularis TaxID=210143 RepID=A0A1R3HQK2_COCAP|nr:hypothetical protein CCACVL1_17647 [Corchorus capsularis]